MGFLVHFVHGLAVAAVAALLTAPHLSAAEVRAWQDTLQLPTYREGDADPDPPFAAFASTGVSFYPYPSRTNFTKDRRDQQWRILNLENEYLVCRILPDLGGHLYSCRDKRSGREMFYANPVIKKAAIGLRGAWAALGIELNFPVGHALHTVSPVDFALRSDPDGSARAIVEDIDRVTGMQWRVEYVLHPGSTVLEQRVVLYNPSVTRRPYYWWANAAVALDDPATRVVLPARLVATHGLAAIDSWPVSSDGKDESKVAGHTEQTAWFAYRSREPFLAVYKPASRTGVAHFADPAILPGKKIWMWGSAQDQYVRRELTDNFSSYVEIQGGLTQNQETYEFLEPEQHRTFSEYWIPIHDAGGVSRVTRDALINLERRTADLKGPALILEVSVTHPVKGAFIRVLSAGKPVFETRVDLDPASTFMHALEKSGAAVYTIQVSDAAGALLIEHTEDRYDAAGPQEVKLGKQPQEDWNKPDETEDFLLARGNYNELHQQRSFAYHDYFLGLRRFPASLPLHKAAGRLALGLNRFEEAANLLGKVHAAAPSDIETSYLLGVVQAMLGRDAEARQTLSGVNPATALGPPAALQLAAVATRAKDYAAALVALKPLLPRGGGPVRGGALEVALLRHSGRTEDALQRLAAWQSIDPAHSMLRFERTLLGSADEALWRHLGADTERVLNLVDEYLNLGMFQDAWLLLSRSYPLIPTEQLEPGAVPPAQSPLIGYYRAFCAARSGEANSSPEPLSKGFTRYVFPSRPSSFQVLQTALLANPSDATAHLLMGRLFMHALMSDEAIAEWQKARAAGPGPAELYRDLARAMIDLKKDAAAGMLVLREGVKIHPQDINLRAALDHAGGSPGRPGPAPATVASTPAAAASAALLAAPSGREAANFFDPAVFSSEKQPDEIRRAYIEVQLQKLMTQPPDQLCPDLPGKIDKLGEEDARLPFTLYGFGNFMKTPHFQYYLGAIESSCRDERSARKRWTKVSRMTAPLPSPEFVFPLLAASKLNPGDAKRRISEALDSIREALAKSQGESRMPLLYIEAMLLRTSGQEEAALQRFQEIVQTTQDAYLSYLAQLGLRDK